MADTLTRLETTIAARRTAPPADSYVASLHAKGLPKIAQKLGEEAVETVIAALSADKAALVSEGADLLFHLLVLLGAKDVPLAAVLAELDRRDGVSGLAEKAARRVEAPAPLPVPASVALPVIGEAEPALALGSAAPAPKRPRIRKG